MSRVLCSGAPDPHLSTEHGEHRVCGLGLLPVIQGANEPNSFLSIPRASTSTQLLTPPAFKSLTQTLLTQSTAYWIPSDAFSMGTLSANMELIFSLNFSHSQWGNKTETWESFSSLPFPTGLILLLTRSCWCHFRNPFSQSWTWFLHLVF